MRVLALQHIGHSPIYLLAFWAVAFVTLSMAVVASNVFSSIIESDFELGTLRKEAILATVGSAIEGVSAWLIAVHVPAGARGMLIPLVVVGLLYQIAHYDTWSRVDGVLLMVFQLAIFTLGFSLLLGHFVFALIVVGAFVLFLALFAVITRSL